MTCNLEKVRKRCIKGRKIPPTMAKNCMLQGTKTIWPFSMLSTKQSECDELIRLHPEYALKYTIDTKLAKFLKKVARKPGIDFTSYEGIIQYAFLGLMFLLKRNPHDCLILSNFDTAIERLLEMKDGEMKDVTWEDIAIVWKPSLFGGFSVSYPGGVDNYIRAARKCQADKRDRFMITIIVLSNRSGSNHANILLYDRNSKECERFDSYQATSPSFNTKKLDESIEKVYRRLDPDFVRMIYPPDSEFYQRMGLQLQQEAENEMITGELDGFCQVYTILYAEMRLTYPSQNPKLLSRNIQNAVRKEDTSITQFMRNYAEEMHRKNQQIIMQYKRQAKRFDKYVDPRIPLLILYLDKLKTYENIYT